MRQEARLADRVNLQPLLELTRRVGSDPLLTQASTGNSSEKVDGVLWIKASGRWMTDAMRDDILIPLDLEEIITGCLQRDVDPTLRFPGASLETAMHASLPHRVVLHAHCVNTIAWAVRKDGPGQLCRRLEGLSWQWVPYTPSGLPLSRGVERALSARPDACVFVLGNHGLVVAGENAKAVEDLLSEVNRRVAITPREAPPADYAALMQIAKASHWDLPGDDGVHALATDSISQAILSRGLLYPCQAIFSGSRTAEVFRAIPYPAAQDRCQSRYRNRPFLIIEGCGVLVNRSITRAELAIVSGLAHVVQRLSESAELRYLTEEELAAISNQVGRRYRELASVGMAGGG